VPPALEALLLRMLARDPAERVARCDEAAEALAPLAGDGAAVTTFLGRLGFSWATPVAGPRHEETPAQALALDHEPTHVIDSTSEESEEIVVGEPLASAPVRPRWRRPAAWAAAALLVAAGAATAWHSAQRRSAARAVATALAAAPPPERPAMAVPPPPAAVGTGAVAAVPGPTLTVVVDVAAARITLDGRVVAEAAHRLHIPVDHPGVHQLEIAAPRRKPYSRTVDVPAAGGVELAVKLEHASTSAATTAKPRPRGEDYLVDPFGAHK
jgi:hypothetical protein